MGIIPYIVLGGRLFTGMILQERAGQGGLVWNIPRGFLDPTKTHFESAAKEMNEETGIKNPQNRLRGLCGEPANSNSTFFDTSAGGGFQYFSFEVFLEEIETTKETDVLKFREGIFKPQTTIAERIVACRFFPWTTAATIRDNFSNAATARLITTYPELRRYL